MIRYLLCKQKVNIKSLNNFYSVKIALASFFNLSVFIKMRVRVGVATKNRNNKRGEDEDEDGPKKQPQPTPHSFIG